VSLDVSSGKTLAILSESGLGKSIAFEAVPGILDSPPGVVSPAQSLF
jgi:ABC-type dipeptide/oligopeptide/nickel transport system ATPase component